MTRTQLILIAAIVLLISLFIYSVSKSGEKAARSDFVGRVHSHVNPGSTREEIEAYLQFLGASTIFEPAADEHSLGVVRAVVFDVRRVGNKRQDVLMEFHFSPDDILQHYIVQPVLVDSGSPRTTPTPQLSSNPSESTEESQEDNTEEGTESAVPTETPAESNETPRPEEEASPAESVSQD